MAVENSRVHYLGNLEFYRPSINTIFSSKDKTSLKIISNDFIMGYGFELLRELLNVTMLR